MLSCTVHVRKQNKLKVNVQVLVSELDVRLEDFLRMFCKPIQKHSGVKKKFTAGKKKINMLFTCLGSLRMVKTRDPAKTFHWSKLMTRPGQSV